MCVRACVCVCVRVCVCVLNCVKRKRGVCAMCVRMCVRDGVVGETVGFPTP